MSEVQKHGFTWEKDLATNVYGATSEELSTIGYTAAMDLPASLNKLDGISVSIKTTCSLNTVCMGNPLRIFDECEGATPFHLTVIYYIQDDEAGVKRVASITEMDLTNSRTLLFGTVTRDQILSLCELVKSVPKGRRQTDDEKKAINTLCETLSRASGAIRFNPKIDSKSQRRLQCSFHHFRAFVSETIPRLVSHSDSNAFRGGAVQAALVSSRRIFRNQPS